MKLAHLQTCQPHRGHIDVCHTYDVYNLIEFKRRINAMRTVKEEEKHTDTHTNLHIPIESRHCCEHFVANQMHENTDISIFIAPIHTEISILS